MGKRMHKAQWGRHCVDEGNPQGDLEVQLWSRLCNRISKRIAHACNVSVSYIHNMIAGEDVSWLTQLRRALDEAVESEQDFTVIEDIIDYLNNRYLIEPFMEEEQPELRIVHSGSLALSRAAAAVEVAIAAAADDDVDDAELGAFMERLWKAHTALRVLQQTLQDANGKTKAG